MRLVFDVHRSAEHDQPAIAVDVGLRVRLAVEIDEADAMATPADQRIKRAERFGGDVLEDENAGHAGKGDAGRVRWLGLRTDSSLSCCHVRGGHAVMKKGQMIVPLFHQLSDRSARTRLEVHAASAVRRAAGRAAGANRHHGDAAGHRLRPGG